MDAMNLQFTFPSLEEIQKLSKTDSRYASLSNSPQIKLGVHESLLQNIFTAIGEIEITGEKEFWTECFVCSGTGKWSWGIGWTKCAACSGRGKWSDTVSYRVKLRDFSIDLQAGKIVLAVTVTAQSGDFSVTDRQTFSISDFCVNSATGEIYASLYLETFRLPNCAPWLEECIRGDINNKVFSEPFKLGEIPSSLKLNGLGNVLSMLSSVSVVPSDTELVITALLRQQGTSTGKRKWHDFLIRIVDYNKFFHVPVPLRFTDRDLALDIKLPIKREHLDIMKNRFINLHEEPLRKQHPNLDMSRLLNNFSNSLTIHVANPYALAGGHADEFVKDSVEKILEGDNWAGVIAQDYARQVREMAVAKIADLRAVQPSGLKLKPGEKNFALWKAAGTPQPGELYRARIEREIQGEKVTWVVVEAEKL